MKATFKSSFLLLIASGHLFSSCVKDEVKAYLNPGGPVQLTAPLLRLCWYRPMLPIQQVPLPGKC